MTAPTNAQKLSTKTVNIFWNSHAKILSAIQIFWLPLFLASAGVAWADPDTLATFSMKLHCVEKMEHRGESPSAAGNICSCFFDTLSRHPKESNFLQVWKNKDPGKKLPPAVGMLVAKQARACVVAEQKIQEHPKEYLAIQKHNAYVAQFNSLVSDRIKHLTASWLADDQGAPVRACSMRITFGHYGNVRNVMTPVGETPCPYWLNQLALQGHIQADRLWREQVPNSCTITVHIEPEKGETS